MSNNLTLQEYDKLQHFLAMARNKDMVQVATRFNDAFLIEIAEICRKIEQAVTSYQARWLVAQGDAYTWTDSYRSLNRADLDNARQVELPFVYEQGGTSVRATVMAYEVEGEYYL